MICHSCGAPVPLDPRAQFAICAHCGTRAELPVVPAQLADTLREDLDEVDRWWEQARRPYMRQDRHGNLHPPQEQDIVYLVLMAVGGILGLACAFAGHKGEWPLLGFLGFFTFPILITLPASILHQRAENRYKQYKELETQYQARRSAIIERRHRPA